MTLCIPTLNKALCCTVAALTFWLPASAPAASAASNARAQTEALVAAYRACCPEASKRQDASCHGVDAFFDYPALAQSAGSPLRSKLSAPQQKRFQTALRDIFARTARQSGKSLCHAMPTIGPEQPHPKGSQVTLEVIEPGEDVPTQLAFVWRKSTKQWRVVDLELEGGSLITDYQNQFSRIEQKEGASGLIRRIEARRQNQDESPNQATPKRSS